MLNTIIIGDCVESLRSIPEGSIDVCVTSPPYYNLRDYRDENQLGLEKTPQEFINNLCNVFDEIYRVLKPSGSCWVNLGDTYHNKKLMQIPSRFEIEMTDRGWYLRNEIIWNKPNPQPMASKDRFWNSHEKFFWFVKHPKKYYFDQQPILLPQAEISVRRMFSKNNLDKRKDQGRDEYSLSGDQQDKHYAKMREKYNIEKDFDYQELIKSGRCPMRPQFTVWDIGATSTKGAHFAVYPPELIKMPILSCCPTGGIVIDPFMGSGTTAIVAKENDRNYIGCELNPEFADIAQKRIKETLGVLALCQ